MSEKKAFPNPTPTSSIKTSQSLLTSTKVWRSMSLLLATLIKASFTRVLKSMSMPILYTFFAKAKSWKMTRMFCLARLSTPR